MTDADTCAVGIGKLSSAKQTRSVGAQRLRDGPSPSARAGPAYLVRLHVDLRYVVQHVARCERTLESLAHVRVDDGVRERGEHLRSKAVFVLAHTVQHARRLRDDRGRG